MWASRSATGMRAGIAEDANGAGGGCQANGSCRSRSRRTTRGLRATRCSETAPTYGVVLVGRRSRAERLVEPGRLRDVVGEVEVEAELAPVRRQLDAWPRYPPPNGAADGRRSSRIGGPPSAAPATAAPAISPLASASRRPATATATATTAIGIATSTVSGAGDALTAAGAQAPTTAAMRTTRAIP